jgi:photosystem II stability/assembly factor-like uncharacterized protein
MRCKILRYRFFPLAFLFTATLAPGASSAGSFLTTPASVVRYYIAAINKGECDLASKFVVAGVGTSLSSFRKSCRAIRKVLVENLDDPGYRLAVRNAVYTCVGIRYLQQPRSGAASSFGGWYLMEKIGPVFWRILLTQSDIQTNGAAFTPSSTVCASHEPSYVHSTAQTAVTGYDFLSRRTGWIARSTSPAFAPNGRCDHGIGKDCDRSRVSIYRTSDAGLHWGRVLAFTGAPLSIWLHVFNSHSGLVAANYPYASASPNLPNRAFIFQTKDGGKHWRRYAFPAGYFVEARSISFVDSQHGWVWYGGGAGGSMAVKIFRTSDGGKHWMQVACTAFSSAPASFGCHRRSGIDLGGDKDTLRFQNLLDGWLTSFSNWGVPDLYHTSNGGTTWQRQAVHPSGARTTPRGSSFGTYGSLKIFGRTGLLSETVDLVPGSSVGTERLYVHRSVDGGRSWPYLKQAPLRAHAVPSALQIQFVDARHWILETPNRVWSSSNGGTSWSHRPARLPKGLKLLSVQFTGPQVGWAMAQPSRTDAGMAGGTELLRTLDGGASWSSVPLP